MIRLRRVLVALLLVCAGAQSVRADFYDCLTRVVPQADLSLITAMARCSWTTPSGNVDTGVYMKGEMTVTPGNMTKVCGDPSGHESHSARSRCGPGIFTLGYSRTLVPRPRCERPRERPCDTGPPW